MPKTTKRTAKKRKVNVKNKKQSVFSVLARNQLAVFVIIFALVGGVFFLYRSSAQTIACRDKVLSRKTGASEKNCVTYLQTALSLHGYDPVDFNGVFTGNTEAAVRAFQIDRQASGLVRDGIVGPQTAAHICSGGVNSNGHDVSKYNFCTANQQSQLSSAVPSQTSSNTVSIQQFGSSSYTSVVNSNTQITNTGGKVQIGNSSSSTGSGTTLPNLPNIDLSKLIKTSPSSNPTTVVNTKQQIDNTGSNIVFNETSTGCSIITLNDRYNNGASRSYDSCDTKNPVATNISKTIKQLATSQKLSPKSNEEGTVSIPENTTVTPIPVSTDPLPVSQSDCPNHDALQLGASGACVRRLQDLLNIRTGAGLNVSGVFDLKTKLALITYQLKNRLAGNGSVTKQMWEILEGTRPQASSDVSPTPGGTSPSTTPETSSGTTTPTSQSPETVSVPPEVVSTSTTTSLPTGTNCINTILKIGSTDTDCIKEAQTRLVERGFSNQPVDGIFSEKTEDSVVNLRLQHTIVPCISGVIDRYVWYVLNGHPDDPYASCNDPIDQQPTPPTTPEVPTTPENPTTPPEPELPSTTPDPQIPAPSAAYELGEDTKIFTYLLRTFGIRSARVCVAVAPTKAGQSLPNTVTTTAGKKIRLTSLPLLFGKKTKIGCVIDSFSRRSSSKEYKVELADYWVSVYGIKLN